jgi:hypothetical protein
LCFRALLFSPQPRPLIIDLFRSRAALEAELLVLRHQINVLRRACPKKHSLVSIDRLILTSVCRLFPAVYDALAIVRPDTVIRWHRKGFKLYWRWKSRRRCGRPIVPLETRNLIRQMSIENPLWGAPRIHGELLKLGIDVSQTSVAKYMVRRRAPPSQGWKTFLRNHADGIAAMDLFVVPTFSFRRLYGLLIMGHGRRQILWFGVTAHPTAEWIANQLTQAYCWKQIPRYLIRDRDGAYGELFVRRLRSMGIFFAYLLSALIFSKNRALSRIKSGTCNLEVLCWRRLLHDDLAMHYAPRWRERRLIC